MNYELNVEFPCGYKYELKAEFGLITALNRDNKICLPDKCPIHGKDCKK